MIFKSLTLTHLFNMFVPNATNESTNMTEFFLSSYFTSNHPHFFNEKKSKQNCY